MINYDFRKAEMGEISQIWHILQDAIKRRNEEGSNQWQDGYPNIEIVKNDIDKEEGFVLTEGETIVGYCAVLINNEPEYAPVVYKELLTVVSPYFFNSPILLPPIAAYLNVVLPVLFV